MSPSFEIGPIRPPSEGGGASLLIRFTRNCPWSRCRFCAGMFYGGARFELRPVSEIKKDIESIAEIADMVKQTSWRLGRAGAADPLVASALLTQHPELRSDQCFIAVFNWMHSGGRTAFVQDADSLIMKTDDIVDALVALRNAFPTLDRVTSYARSKTLFRKSIDELRRIRESGLKRLHIGLETGDDELLDIVQKGVTSEQHMAAGRMAKDAGFELSVYIMPDLGGRTMSEQHAVNTARVLNAINPDFIRSRPFIPRPGTPMYDDYASGKFQLSSPHERLKELRALVEKLEVTSRLCFDHFGNSWFDRSGQPLFRRSYEGYKLPEEKQIVLDLIQQGLSIEESHHTHAREFIELPHL